MIYKMVFRCPNWTVTARVALIPLAVSLLLGFFIDEPVFRSPYYTIPLVVVFAVCAFSSFTILSDYLHRKAIQPEDLRDDQEIDERLRSKYIKRYRVAFILGSVLLVGCITYYTVYIAIKDATDLLTALGVIGGMCSLFGQIHKTYADWLLEYLNWRKGVKQARSPSLRPEVMPPPTPTIQSMDLAALPPPVPLETLTVGLPSSSVQV